MKECGNCGKIFRMPIDWQGGFNKRRKYCSEKCRREMISWKRMEHMRNLRDTQPERFAAIVTRDFAAMGRKRWASKSQSTAS